MICNVVIGKVYCLGLFNCVIMLIKFDSVMKVEVKLKVVLKFKVVVKFKVDLMLEMKIEFVVF